MQLPVHDPNHPPERSPSEMRAAALAIQSNLAQLRDLDARNAGVDPETHDIRVPHHSSVNALENALFDDKTLTSLSTEQVHAHLHEVWGQFCVMCWLFSLSHDPGRANFAELEPGTEPHCRTAIEAKHAEVHALLWRIVFEQRLRNNPAYAASPRFAEDRALADVIPAVALGRSVDRANDAELMLAACEHAGMLSTLRWLLDVRREWGDPTLTALDDRPF